MVRTPAEISEIASRGLHHVGAKYEIAGLRHDIERAGSQATPFLDLIPIRLTTIIEHTVRSIVQEAVDFGEPYSGRGITMISRWSGKILAESLLAFSKKKVTLGQLASHGFSIGRLTDMIAVLEAVLGNGVSSEISTARTRWIEPECNEPDPIITDPGLTMQTIDRLLTVRHIVVHERPKVVPYERTDIAIFLEHAERFVSALDWIKVGRLYGTLAYTQTQINIGAAERAAKISDRLDALRGGTEADFLAPEDDSQRIEFYWDKLCDLAARRHAGYLDEGWPGTIAPLLHALAKERMMQWRIDNQDLFRRWDPT